MILVIKYQENFKKAVKFINKVNFFPTVQFNAIITNNLFVHLLYIFYNALLIYFILKGRPFKIRS